MSGTIDALDHAVYVKDHWNHDWGDPVPYLFAERVTFSVAPAISHAELSYRAGDKIMRHDQTSFDSYPRLSLQGKYVRISINQSDDSVVRWYGTIVDRDEMLLGMDASAGNPERDSRQTFIAYGLEFLLDRRYITTSAVEREDGSVDLINRAIGFNLGPGAERDRKRAENSSINKGPDDAFVFAKSLHEGDASFWNADDIIQYLTAYHMPADIDENQQIPWYYNDTVEQLPFIAPSMQVHGRTVREVLNMLMDRRRGLSWALNVSDDETRVEIVPISFGETDIHLPSGDGFIPANFSQKAMNFDTELRARESRLITSRANVYKSVIARGERRGAVFTCSHGDSTHDWVNFDKNWTADLEDDYIEAASGDPAYASLPDWIAQQTANQEARRKTKLESVYRFFAIPETWDGKTNSGHPTILQDDFSGGQRQIWIPGLRFEHHLPMYDGVDYTGSAIADGTPASFLPDDELGDFLRPTAWIDTGADAHVYERVDRLGLGLKEGLISPETLARSYAMGLRMHKDDLGFSVDVHGAPQLVIAKDDFIPADDNGPDSNDWQADSDWKKLLVTVYMLSDDYAEGQWPDLDNDADGEDVHQVLVIQVQNYFCDYVLKDTVLDTDTNGQLMTVTQSGYVRDDRDKLQDMARLAYEWYSVERIALDVTFHSLDASVGAPDNDTLNIGDMITTLGQDSFETCNSVVTEISFDTRAQTRTIKTQFVELDVASLARGGSL